MRRPTIVNSIRRSSRLCERFAEGIRAVKRFVAEDSTFHKIAFRAMA